MSSFREETSWRQPQVPRSACKDPCLCLVPWQLFDCKTLRGEVLEVQMVGLGVLSGFSLAAGDEGDFCELSHMVDTRRGHACEDFCSPTNGLSFCLLPTRTCLSELKLAEGADSAHSTNVVQGPRRRL